jgi:hypothetical protein
MECCHGLITGSLQFQTRASLGSSASVVVWNAVIPSNNSSAPAGEDALVTVLSSPAGDRNLGQGILVGGSNGITPRTSGAV